MKHLRGFPGFSGPVTEILHNSSFGCAKRKSDLLMLATVRASCAQLPPLRATSSDTRLAVKVVVTSKLLGPLRGTETDRPALLVRSVPPVRLPRSGPGMLKRRIWVRGASRFPACLPWPPFLPGSLPLSHAPCRPAARPVHASLPYSGLAFLSPDRSAGRPKLSQPAPQAVTMSPHCAQCQAYLILIHSMILRNWRYINLALR